MENVSSVRPTGKFPELKPFSSMAILYHVTNSAAGVLEKPETGIRNRKGNAKVNRNRNRKRNGKRNLYKSRDNIYLNLS